MTAGESLRGGAVGVVEGKDGWLFLARYETHDVMRFYCDETAMPEPLLAAWAAALSRRRQYFAQRGIHHLTLVVPDACLAYPDKLPASVRLAPRSPYARLVELLDPATRASCIYPLPALIDGRRRWDTYQSIDSHWTDWGAWLGYQAVMDALQPLLPALRRLRPDDVQWSPRRTFGALGAVVAPERSAELPTARIERPQGRMVKNVLTEVRDSYLVVEQDDARLPTAVIFRDSFMTHPGKFFSESFRRVVYVTSPNTIFYDLVEAEAPDFVLFEVAERRLHLPPEEPSPQDFRFHFADLLLDDAPAVELEVASRSALREGDAKAALAASNAVLARVAPTARLLVHRHEVLMRLDRVEEAIATLREATALDGDDAYAWFLLGTALRRQGRAAETRAALERAVALEPAQERFRAALDEGAAAAPRATGGLLGSVDQVDDDEIAGWAFDPLDPTRRVHVQAFYDGRLLSTTVANFPRADLAAARIGDGAHGFYVPLPSIEAAEVATIVVRAAGDDQPIGRPRTISRQPRRHANGLTAAEMLRLHRQPLYAISGLLFDGEKLVLSGFHLPPGGNPSTLAVRTPPGLAVDFRYPQLQAAVRDTFWYWPNAAWSGFTLEVDLNGSTAEGELELAFESESDEPATRALGRNHINVPKHLDAYQRFPRGDQLARVQTWDNARSVAIRGYCHARQLVRAAAHYDLDLRRARVLDWGCGHGRVLRHLQQEGLTREAWGVDIDAENVGWLQRNLAGIRASTVGLMPPTQLPSAYFDLVYGISVMTHLTRAAQQSWLAELRRVARPGGLVLLTITGPTAVAHASQYLSSAWLQEWLASGFDDRQVSHDLIGKIGDDDYYRNTFQSWEATRAAWSEHFEVLAIHEAIFGYQDLVVLRAT